MFAEGAKALLPGQGKHIVGPFANEKKVKEKRRRAGSGERCLAGQGGRDYTPVTFSSTRRKCKGSTGEEKLNPCTSKKREGGREGGGKKFSSSQMISNTVDCRC